MWTGPGIQSTTAATCDPSHLTTIGYADNSALGASSFKGVSPLTGGDILVKYTYYGDANLDGAVTLSDFNRFLTGFQGGGGTPTWLTGDFDYNGKVNLDDFTLFLDAYKHQGAQLASLGEAVVSANVNAANEAMMLAAIQAVPEPTIVALLGVAGVGLGLVHRRCRRSTASTPGR